MANVTAVGIIDNASPIGGGDCEGHVQSAAYDLGGGLFLYAYELECHCGPNWDVGYAGAGGGLRVPLNGNVPLAADFDNDSSATETSFHTTNTGFPPYAVDLVAFNAGNSFSTSSGDFTTSADNTGTHVEFFNANGIFFNGDVAGFVTNAPPAVVNGAHLGGSNTSFNLVVPSSPTVTPTPTKQPLVADFIFPTPVTAGKPVEFSGSASGGTPPFSASWDVGKDGIIESTAFPHFTHVFPTKGSFSVDLTVTDANGTIASVNKKVTVLPQPLVISASCTDGTAGKPIQCNASATGGSTPYTFQWDVGKDGIIDGTGAKFQPVFPVKGTFSIDAIVVDANGATARVNLLVQIAPQPLVISASCTDGTAGKPIQCNASATGGSTPYTFQWDVGKDGTIDGVGTKFQPVFPVKGIFSIDAIVVDANGATARVNLTVRIAAQPLVVDFTFDPAAPTDGKPVTFTPTISGGHAPYTCTWDVGKDGSVEGTSCTSFTYSFPVKGSFSVDLRVTDANGTVVTKNKPVTVAAQPLVASIVIVVKPERAKLPQTFRAQVSGGTLPYTCEWDANKDNVVDLRDDCSGEFTFTPLPLGRSEFKFSVSLKVTDANGTIVTDNHSNVIVGGISQDPDIGALTAQAPQSSGSDAGLVAGVIAGTAAGAVALGGAAWYARRRSVR